MFKNRNVAVFFGVGLLFLFIVGLVPASQAESPPGAYENALDQVGADTGRFPYTYRGRLELANKLARNDHYDAAIGVYDQLLADFPENPDIFLMRGRTHGWVGNLTRAQQDLETVVETNPEYADAWQILGNVYRWSDQNDSAVKAYTNWIELEPDRPEPYLHRGDVFRDQGRYDRAEEDFQTAAAKGAEPSQIPSAEPGFKSGVRANDSWEARTGYRRTFLSGGTSNWTRYEASIKKNLDFGSLTMGAFRAEHFNTWNTGILMDGYFDLPGSRYLNLRYQVSPEHDFLPKNDVLVEGYQPFGSGWEGSLGFRAMDFDNSDVRILKVGLARYWGNFYGRYVIRDISNETSDGLFNSLSLRWYINGPDHFVGLRGGVGEEVIEISPSNPAGTVETETIGARYQVFLDETNGFDLSVNYVGPDGQAIRRSVSVDYLRRW